MYKVVLLILLMLSGSEMALKEVSGRPGRQSRPAAHGSVGKSLSTLPYAGVSLLTPQMSLDLNFDPTVARPAYPKQHPKVLFDEGHNNAYTSTGGYRPFADLLRSDGYGITANRDQFSKKSLKKFSVLIIVNAAGPQTQREASAFTKEECLAVRDWVKDGGALLLICDHAPFGSAAAELSQELGVEVTKGYTVDTEHSDKDSGDATELVFTRDNGLIVDHPLTRGRDATERINRIITFSGTSLKSPPGSVSFLRLADTAKDVLPPDDKTTLPGGQQADYKTNSAAGRAQGVALELGKGRVVVLTEAAMFTAQVAPKGFRFGMNLSGIDNRQLALNAMHWLSHILK